MVPELSRAQAAFIQGPVSISLASRDAARRTTIARGLYCRVSETREQIAILACGVRAAPLLADLLGDEGMDARGRAAHGAVAGEGMDARGRATHGAVAGGWVAASYSLPATHETLQVKGRDARVEPARPGDEALAAAHRAAFATQIAVAGFTVAFTEALLHHEPGQLCWVCFTPAAVYVQTPGPRAGERLKAGG